MLTKRDPDELARASEQRTAKNVVAIARAMAQAVGLRDIPSTWYSILRVALKDTFLSGEKYAHEIPTMRDTERGFPKAEEPTVKTRIPR